MSRVHAFFAAAATLVAVILLLSWRQKFDPDEFEGMHTAWKLLQGERIYAGFFQHHHPLLYYLLVPLHVLMGETPNIAYAARALMLPFVFGTLWLAWRLARDLHGPQVAAVTVLLIPLLSTLFSANLETRPDVAQVFFALLSTVLLYRYLESRRRRTLLLAGLALGIAFLFLQKALLFAIALALVLAPRLWQRTVALREVLWFVAAGAVAPLAYLAYVAAHGEFGAYFFFNFRFNAGMGHDASQAQEAALRLASVSPAMLPFLLYGLFAVRKTPPQREIAWLAIALFAIIVGAGMHFRQYYLMLLPFASIIAAHGFVTLLGDRPRIAVVAGILVAAPSLWGYAGLIRDGNAEQVARVAYVLDKAPPGSTVYDGANQFNLFRRDLDFFWFSLLPGQALDRYRQLHAYPYDVTDLIDRHRPAVISAHGVPNLYDRRIQAQYRTSRYPDLFLLRPDR